MKYSPAPEPLDLGRERVLLVTLAGIQFAHILDFMIMMPLGPILIRELGVGTHEFGLLVSAYTFTAAFTGVLAAVFVDRFERKRMLLVMFALFALATLACGLAPGFVTLLLARSTAGAFGGVLGSMVQTRGCPKVCVNGPKAGNCHPSKRTEDDRTESCTC
jgi:predicted MFS family arabinose efflux permease